MKRRDFIKRSTISSAGVIFINSVLGCDPIFKGGAPALGIGSISELYKGFQSPPVGSKLFVRWWWNGNRLSGKEILRELDVMKDAGIGGLEINPIAFPYGADPSGYKALTIFDGEWLGMLKVALEGAKQRGMVCDMIVLCRRITLLLTIKNKKYVTLCIVRQ